MADNKKRKKKKRPVSNEDWSFFAPNKYALDEEWVNQPALYFQYASELEEANIVVSETKAEVDLVAAEIDACIRQNPTKYKLPEKLNESMIKAKILTRRKYKEAQERHLKARKKVGVLRSAVTALDHRKKALEKLVDLHGQKYFAKPQTSVGKSGIEFQEELEEAEHKIAKKRRRAKRREQYECFYCHSCYYNSALLSVFLC